MKQITKLEIAFFLSLLAWCFIFTPVQAAGIDSNTILMLHCDGTDGSQAITDSSDYNNSITVSNNTQIDNSQSVFGGTSCYFDGTDDALNTTGNALWNFGTSNFTIDMRVRQDTLANYRTFASERQGGFFNTGSDASGNFTLYDDAVKAQKTSAFNADTWYMVSYEQYNNIGYLYIDGLIVATGSYTPNITGNPNFWIGAHNDLTEEMFGWIDEIRVSNIARYQGQNFTPPTEAYSANSTPPATETGLSTESVPLLRGINVSLILLLVIGVFDLMRRIFIKR